MSRVTILMVKHIFSSHHVTQEVPLKEWSVERRSLFWRIWV